MYNTSIYKTVLGQEPISGLAFFEFLTVLENKRFFELDLVPLGNFIRS